MENSTHTNESGRSRSWLGFCGGLLLLICGGVIGVFAAKVYWDRSAAAAAPSMPIAANAAIVAPPEATVAQWDPIRQLNAMQAEVNQVFQRSFAQFQKAEPEAVAAKPGYSLSMDVRNMPSQYQVRAFLPETNPSDVKVNLKGDELKVSMAKEVTEKPTAKNGETAMREWGNYEEVVQLAGPLKDSQMKVERMPHELIISVPKA